MRFESKSKMEDIAWDAGMNVALEWDGEKVEEVLQVVGIATGWNERELAAFKAGFDETRNDPDDIPDELQVSREESGETTPNPGGQS